MMLQRYAVVLIAAAALTAALCAWFMLPASGSSMAVYAREPWLLLSVLDGARGHVAFASNPRLGLPGSFDALADARIDAGTWVFIKLAAWFSHDALSAANTFFVLRFAAFAAVATWALCLLHLSYVWSVAGGVLMALLPTQFAELGVVTGTATLGAPLLLAVLIQSARAPRLPLRTPVLLCAGVACLSVGAGLLGAALALGLGFVQAAAQRNARPLWQNLPLALAAGGVAAMHAALSRTPLAESGTDGTLADWPSQGAGTLLGLAVSVAALIFALRSLVVMLRDDPAALRLRQITALAMFVMLYAVLAGNLRQSWPMLPAVRQLGAYVAFLALVAVAPPPEPDGARWPRWLTLMVAIALTVADLSGRSHTVHDTRPLYAADAAYFRALESLVPAQTRVFNLPYVSYPSASDSTLRAYVHSKTFLWSYGTTPGTAADSANSDADVMLLNGNPQAFLAYLKAQNFGGVLFNQDVARSLGRAPTNYIHRLEAIFGLPIAVDAHQQFVYYKVP